MKLLLLFFEFFKTGLLAVGGGLATLPFLYQIAEKYDWFTTKELANMIAISESTPGAIGINMSTYAGFNTGGIIGGILSTLSLILPSIVIIILISKALERFQKSGYVQTVFSVLRPMAVGLIAAALYQLFKISVLNLGAFSETGNPWSIFDAKAGIVFIALFILCMKWKKHPIVFIGIGAALGIVLKM